MIAKTRGFIRENELLSPDEHGGPADTYDCHTNSEFPMIYVSYTYTIDHIKTLQNRSNRFIKPSQYIAYIGFGYDLVTNSHIIYGMTDS